MNKNIKEKEEFTNVFSIIFSPFTYIYNLIKNIYWCCLCCCCLIILLPFIQRLLRNKDSD